MNTPITKRRAMERILWNAERFQLRCASALLLMVAGCASAPLDRAGSLATYDNLVPSKNLLTRAQLGLSKDNVLAARTVQIVPTVFSSAASDVALTETQRRMIANAIDRSICVGLSDRFQVVPLVEQADLTVHAVITHIGRTNATLAGVSKVASVATSILSPVPIPTPRIPFGLGSLSIEAEARDQRGEQKAAIVWARGAIAFMSSPKVSAAGDAYDLASSFGNDFSKMLVKGTNPFKGMPSLPSIQKINSSLGRAPRHSACEAFGRGPGVRGLIAGGLGLPPEWTNKPNHIGTSLTVSSKGP